MFKLCHIYIGFILFYFTFWSCPAFWWQNTHTYKQQWTHSLIAYLRNTVHSMVQSLSGSLWNSQTVLHHLKNYPAGTTFTTSVTVNIFVLECKYPVVDTQCFPSYPCSNNKQVTRPLLYLFFQHSPVDQHADQQHAIYSDYRTASEFQPYFKQVSHYEATFGYSMSFSCHEYHNFHYLVILRPSLHNLVGCFSWTNNLGLFQPDLPWVQHMDTFPCIYRFSLHKS